MKSLINKNTGKLICATVIDIELTEDEILIDELLIEYLENPYFNFETRQFYNKEL